MFVLWNMIFVGSNASLFVLLPFAYFYKEGLQYSTSTSDLPVILILKKKKAFEGKKGRLTEATTVMTIFIVILFSFFFLAHNLLFGYYNFSSSTTQLTNPSCLL